MVPNDMIARLLMQQKLAQPSAQYALAPQAQGAMNLAQGTLAPPSGADPRNEALAQQLMQSGMDASPIRSPLQGLARLAQGWVGGKVAKKEKDADEARKAAINDLFVKATKGDKDATTQLAGADPQKAALAMALLGQSQPKKFSGTLSPGEVAIVDGEVVADNPKPDAPKSSDKPTSWREYELTTDTPTQAGYKAWLDRNSHNVDMSPENIQRVVEQIGTYRKAPLGAFALRSAFGQAVTEELAKQYPQYDETTWQAKSKAIKDFTSGKLGANVRSFNVSLEHLDTLSRIADGLNNNNIQLVNEAANFYKTQTGQPGPANFEAAKKIVADEIVKAIVGSGGGVTDREEAAKNIQAASSPAQLKGVIATYQELMAGQLHGLESQYQAATGLEDFSDRFLSDAARKYTVKVQSKPKSEIDALLNKYPPKK